jgi:hypothetical protein
VYPAMEKYLGDAAKAQADRDREQHHKVSGSHGRVADDLVLILQRSRYF